MDHSTNPAPGTVTHGIALELVDADGEMREVGAVLSYDPSDPFAVTATFRQEPEVSWTFSRDLLRTGVHAPAGDGDVHVRPCLDHDGRAIVVIEFHTPNGVALVQARTRDLHPFISRMTAAVLPGAEAEHLDIDSAVQAILVTAAGE